MDKPRVLFNRSVLEPRLYLIVYSVDGIVLPLIVSMAWIRSWPYTYICIALIMFICFGEYKQMSPLQLLRRVRALMAGKKRSVQNRRINGRRFRND